LRSDGPDVALHGDLNLDHNWAFFGKLILKPARRHRIVLEGAPYEFSGSNTLARTVIFNGSTYSIADTVASDAELTYFYGGYQYDLLSRDQGHLGLETGGAYLDGSGTIRGVTSGITASRSQRVGLPLAGAEFRVFLLPHRRLVNVNGEVKGMAFGGYGNFFQGGANVGVGFRWITLQAGYQYLNADIHENRSVNPAGINAIIQGPIFSLQIRDR
jgi:hypothetical protein